MEEVDLVFENHRGVPELSPAPSTEKDLLIGGHIAELIDDGSTLQVGIGGIPKAVTSMLMKNAISPSIRRSSPTAWSTV